MAKLELYGTARCPYTGEMRDWLEWKRSEFVEYDVEADPVARGRMREVSPPDSSRAFQSAAVHRAPPSPRLRAPEPS